MEEEQFFKGKDILDFLVVTCEVLSVIIVLTLTSHRLNAPQGVKEQIILELIRVLFLQKCLMSCTLLFDGQSSC